MPEQERLLHSTSEAAQLLNVSARTVSRMLDDDRLKAIRIGSRVLIPRESLIDFIHRTLAEDAK